MTHLSSTLSQLITNSNFLIFYLSNHINFARESISACVYDMLFHVFHALKGKFIRSRNNLSSDSVSISANQLRFPFPNHWTKNVSAKANVKDRAEIFSLLNTQLVACSSVKPNFFFCKNLYTYSEEFAVYTCRGYIY